MWFQSVRKVLRSPPGWMRPIKIGRRVKTSGGRMGAASSDWCPESASASPKGARLVLSDQVTNLRPGIHVDSVEIAFVSRRTRPTPRAQDQTQRAGEMQQGHAVFASATRTVLGSVLRWENTRHVTTCVDKNALPTRSAPRIPVSTSRTFHRGSKDRRRRKISRLGCDESRLVLSSRSALLSAS